MVINFNSALNQNSLKGGFLTGSKTNTGQTITGQTISESDEGGISNLVSFQNFLGGGLDNPQSIFRNTHNNLINLGLASVDRAKENKENARAINEQIAIREAQRQSDLGFSTQIQDQLNAHVESVNSAAGSSAAGSSDSFFDGFPALPSFAQLRTPLIIAGAALAALIILPRLIKGGFK